MFSTAVLTLLAGLPAADAKEASPSAAVSASVEAAAGTITVDDLKAHVSFLASDTLEGRGGGTNGGKAAAAYLADHFRKLGLKPFQGDDFRIPVGDTEMQNVVAQWGTGDLPPVIVSGHYDHVGMGNRFTRFIAGLAKKRHRVVTARPNPSPGPIHNGADDNASGTSLVLEVAEACSKLPAPTKRPVLFALWDGEELGLIGSAHFAKAHEDSPAALAIVTDMVGRASCDRMYIYGSTTVPGLEEVVSEEAVAPLKPVYLHSHLPRSDHWPFYSRGVPYLFFHTGLHPEYHRPEDDPDRINYKTLRDISRTAFLVLHRVLADDFEITLDPASKDLPKTMMPPKSECPPDEGAEDLKPVPAESD